MAVWDKFRAKIGQKTGVKRYWPGKPPEWAADNDEEGGDIPTAAAAAVEKVFPIHDAMRKHHPTLRRLALSSRIDDRDRRIRPPEIVSTAEEESVDVEEEAAEFAMMERRRRLREKLLRRRQEEEEEEDAALLLEEEEEEEEEEEMSGDAGYAINPVFVPKSERYTIAIEAEQRAFEQAEEKKKMMEESKKKTRRIVFSIIKEDLEMDLNVADVDIDDDVNESEESYQAWKAREIARIKKAEQDREAKQKGYELVEESRKMSEEERRESSPRRPKRKLRFAQRYYHKGCYFQTGPDGPAGAACPDCIYSRDFSAPTGEDNMDKTKLPRIMQVRNFGRRGRTKRSDYASQDSSYCNRIPVLA